MFNQDIKQQIIQLIQEVNPDITTQVNVEIIKDIAFGDYSTNIPFQLASIRHQSPTIVAQGIVDKLNLRTQDLFEKITCEAGYINFTLSNNYLTENIAKVLGSDNKYGSSQIGIGKKILVEYFSNNVAKPPHIGHLRSAVLGDSLYRIFKFLGYETVSDAHIGDWGTQFGILIYGVKNYGDMEVIKRDPVVELNKIYILTSNKIKQDPKIRDLGKAEFEKLESGDKENRELWQWFIDVSVQDFKQYQKLLKINEFDYYLGESFYEDKMGQVLKIFESKDLVKIGETGEKYVDLEEYKLGRCILYKSDGASTYHMRDFATYIYRKDVIKFYRNYYVVDNRQEHHFKQLFKVLELAGFNVNEDSKLISFGFMSLPEGPISTRNGTVISLDELIKQANTRALAIINQKNPDLEDKNQVAQKVGLAAIKYFDLSHNPKTEIVFTWDKALSFEGNTGPYLQYTYARISGIVNKSGLDTTKLASQPFFHELDLASEERAVLRKINQFPDIVLSAGQNLLPNIICNYLFELAQLFNTFYQLLPVLNQDNEEVRDFRLKLCLATAQVIKNGLDLLGIESPSRM